MLEELKQKVYEANMELPRRKLITYTWGNVSGIDRASGLFVIKPSGVEYDELKPEDLVVVDLDGNKVEGKLRPSSDTETHRILYRAFPEIGGIVHTHADYFYGDIPCTRSLTKEEIEAAYELNTGNVIVETFTERKINPVFVPAVICANHGSFTWGKDAAQAVYHSVVLEEVAKMATFTELNNPKVARAPQYIQDKHFMRKHGPNAYYGQG
ncbi:MAG: L-ribulose-5-phosphate 4-epimerase [Quinella sp. 2Q5]|nr:L-ribulose-5-phosphate 4-epimerase [Quinella sp. 2Q5]